LLLLQAICLANTARAQQAVETFKFKRGINVESLIVLSPKVIDGRSYPYYDFDKLTFGRQNPAALTAAGFDAVRLTVEPVPLLALEEPERAKIYPVFKKIIDRFLTAGLKVIFDLHMTDRDPRWNPASITSGKQADRLDRYLEVISSVSRIVASYEPSRVAFELFNEPPCIAASQWAPVQRKMYDVARRSLPRHNIVVTGVCYDSIDGLVAIDPHDYDERTLFTFHFYLPTVFTFQGLPWIRDFKYVRGLSYPPAPEQRERAIGAMAAALSNASDLNAFSKVRLRWGYHNRIVSYLDTPMDRQWLKAQVERVHRWAEQHAVAPSRIFVGEFGAHGDASAIVPQDRVRWLTDVRSSFEEFGFPWAVWSDCCAFAVTTGPNQAQLDPTVLGALGLSGQPSSKGIK
jgi:hypothetical protein